MALAAAATHKQRFAGATAALAALLLCTACPSPVQTEVGARTEPPRVDEPIPERVPKPVRRPGFRLDPVVSLATDEVKPNRIAVDETYAYWLAAGAVRRVSKFGGQAETLAAGLGALWEIALGADAVYAVSLGDGYGGAVGAGVLYEVPKAGGAVKSLATGIVSPTPIAVDETHVYYGSAQDPINFSAPSASIYRVAKSGGPPTLLADKQTMPNAVAVDDRHLYWANLGGKSELRRVPRAGGPIETLASGVSSPTAIYLLANGLAIAVAQAEYSSRWTGNDDGSAGLLRFAKDGAKLEIIHPYPANASAMDGATFCWQNELAIRCAASAGGPIRLVTNERSFGFSVLAADDGYVYWADDDQGTIRRVRTDGGLQVVGEIVHKPGGVVVDDAGAYYLDTDDGMHTDVSTNAQPDQVVHAIAGGPRTILTNSADDIRKGSQVSSSAGDNADYFALRADSTHLFFGDWGRKKIFRLAKTGGKPVVHAEANPADLVVDDASVYWVDGATGHLWRSPKSGGKAVSVSRQAVPPTGRALTTSMAVDDEAVYFTAPSQSEVRRLEKTHDKPTILASGQHDLGPLAVAGDQVYWASGSTVVSALRRGGTALPRGHLPGRSVALIAADGSTVIVVTAADHGRRRRLESVDHGGVRTLVDGLGPVGGLALTSDSIYWTSASHDAVLRLSR